LKPLKTVLFLKEKDQKNFKLIQSDIERWLILFGFFLIFYNGAKEL